MRNWNKAAQQGRVRRNGTQDRDHGSNLPPVSGVRRGPVLSKEELRREADRLLAAGTVQVTRIPAGERAMPEKLTGQQRTQVSRQIKGLKRSSADRPQIRGPIDRSVPPGLAIYADGACEPNPGVGGTAVNSG